MNSVFPTVKCKSPFVFNFRPKRGGGGGGLFAYIIEVRLNASAASCLKCRPVPQVWKDA